MTARIVDRWRLGEQSARVCIEPPGGPAECERRAIAAGSERVRFRALRPGGWRIRLKTPWGGIVREVRARPRSGRLTLLATGDSMIQGIDHALNRRLSRRGVRVVSDARISTGISKPSALDWQAHARAQAAGRRPDVTVMFLGAKDGFPMGDAPCCEDAWVEEYARRAGRMIDAYARSGRGRVYWMLLPTPRGGFFRQTFPAVNAAVRRATAAAKRDARPIDLPAVFTPGNRYRASMRIGGRGARAPGRRGPPDRRRPGQGGVGRDPGARARADRRRAMIGRVGRPAQPRQARTAAA